MNILHANQKVVEIGIAAKHAWSCAIKGSSEKVNGLRTIDIKINTNRLRIIPRVICVLLSNF